MTTQRRKRAKDGLCPICGEPSAEAVRPFCSERCRLRDLAHWIGAAEPYVIPGEPIAPAGHELSDEELALLEEAEGEASGPPHNVIRADFRRRSRLDGDDGEA